MPFAAKDISDITVALLAFFAKYPWLATLLILSLLDVVSGLLVAVVRKKVSSSISARGASRKAMMYLVVGVAAVIDPYAGDVPLTKLVAFFYVVTEAISVLENAALMGVPLPRALIDTLANVKSMEKVHRAEESGIHSTGVHTIEQLKIKEVKVESGNLVQQNRDPSSSGIGIGNEPEHRK